MTNLEAFNKALERELYKEDAGQRMREVEKERARKVNALTYLEAAFNAAGKDLSFILTPDGNVVEVTDLGSYKHILVNIAGDSSTAMILDICRQAYELLL